MKTNINYEIDYQNEADGLVFTSVKEKQRYNFLIIRSLLLKSCLEIWVKEKDYDKGFIEKHINSLIDETNKGRYIRRGNGLIVISEFYNF